MIRSLIKKYKAIPIQVKASMWFFACSIIQKMVSVVSTAVFTRLMSTEDYGLISIFTSWSNILVIIATLNLSTACFNVGMTKYENDRKRWVSSLQILSVLAAFLFNIVFIGFYGILGKVIDLPVILIIIMLLSFYFSPAINLWTSKQRYEYSYIRLVAVTIGYAIAVFVLSLVAILVSEHKGVAKIIGTEIATLIFGTVLFIDNVKNSKPVVNKSYMRFAAKYNLQMMPAFLGAVIMSQIDRVMIDNMVNRESAGIYSVAYNAAFMISIVSTSISAAYNPWMVQRVKKNDYSRTTEIGNGISFMFLMLILVFTLCAPEFVKILAPSTYLEAIYIIPSVAGSTFFNLIYTLYGPVLQYRIKTKQLSLITAVTAVLNIILNYFAIKQWGYIAAGYTTFICYFVYGWGTAAYAVYQLKKDQYNGKIYDSRKLGLMTLALIVSVIVIPFTYKGYLLRYMMLLAIAFFFVSNLRKIMRPFFEIRKG